jgi:hypothetical protein
MSARIRDLSPKQMERLAAQPWWPFESRPMPPRSHPVQPPAGVYAAFVNNRYSVQVSVDATEWGAVHHLWIRRHDEEPVRSWPDVQRIKREILHDGADRVGVEVYPRDVDVVDAANIYHLWVMPVGFRLPFALDGRR